VKRDWSTGAEDLFVAGRRAHRPRAGDRERVRRALASKIVAVGAGAAVGAGVGGVAGATTKAATKGLLFGLLAKLGVPVLLVAGAAGTAAVLSAPPAGGASESGAAVAPARAAAPSAIPRALQPGPLRPVVTAPIRVDRAEPVAASAPAPARTPAARDDSADELALVRAMDAALRAGDFAGASRLAREHERRFPNGALTQERAGASAIAACRSGAPGAGEAFLRAYPRSPLAARVRVACGITEREAPGQ
jgi:hypothetical protein